jgi:hypothetical protein
MLERHRMKFCRDTCREITPGRSADSSAVSDFHTFTGKKVSLEVVSVYIDQSWEDDAPVRVNLGFRCRLLCVVHGSNFTV